ncbi:MAG TPA: hypothetical protein VJ829_05895 [Candidatus Binatia bacterium]|nr:hypothetical protein [Candidatus Binatia bacterium]
MLLALALAGCSALRHAPSPLAGNVTAEELLDGLAARRAATTSLRARARLKAGLAGLWTRQAVLVQRPGEVRMDVMSPFGLALAVGTQHDLLWAYSPSQRVRYEGEASPLNLAHFLGAPVSVGDLVDILLGLPPGRVATAPATLSRGAEGALVVTVPFDGGTQVLSFDPATRELQHGEERRGDAVALSVSFTDYEDGFPHGLDVAAPVVGSAAKLAYDSVERNVPLDETLFAPPSAPRVVPLEAAPTG